MASTTPATPPGVRVCTGRFDGLTSRGEPGHPQFVEESVRQREMEVQRRVMPPPAAVACNPTGGVITHPASTQLAIDGGTSLPVFELQRPQAVTYPFVDIRKDPRCLGDLKVGLPSRQVLPQFLAHGRHAFPTTRRVSIRTRSFTRLQDSDATRNLTFRPGAIQNEKPRNLRSVARATALLASLMRSFSRA